MHFFYKFVCMWAYVCCVLFVCVWVCLRVCVSFWEMRHEGSSVPSYLMTKLIHQRICLSCFRRNEMWMLVSSSVFNYSKCLSLIFVNSYYAKKTVLFSKLLLLHLQKIKIRFDFRLWWHYMYQSWSLFVWSFCLNLDPSYLEHMRDTGRRTYTIVVLDKVACVSQLFSMIGQLSGKFDVILMEGTSWQEISQIGYNSNNNKYEAFLPEQSSTVFVKLG